MSQIPKKEERAYAEGWSAGVSILNSLPSKPPTVAEVFARAGFPVPSGAKVFFWDYWEAWDGTQAWHFAIASILNPDNGPGWVKATGSWGYRKIIDISNLPAVDAAAALPSVLFNGTNEARENPTESKPSVPVSQESNFSEDMTVKE